MKITLAQINVHIGNFELNVNKMISAIHQAEQDGADIICFPELVTSGYPPRDFLEFNDFIDSCQETIEALKKHTHKVAVVCGSPRKNPEVEGKDLFNSAYFIFEGKVLHISDKALLPTYDVFDEYRYFEPGRDFKVVSFKGKKIALTVCEDIWNIGNENPLYNLCPLDELIGQSPDFILNISASPFSYEQAKTRKDIVRQNTAKYNIPLFYVNHAGAQTELIFDGGSVIANAKGIIFREMPYFEEAIETFDLDQVINNDQNHENQSSKIELIHDALVLGIKDYFGKLGFKKAIIGLSGGIDSAVTTGLAVEALGAEHVRVLLMPSQFSSDHSISDAEQLAQNYGIQYDTLAIADVFESFDSKLKPLFKDLPFNVAEENIQARVRGTLLMAVSNKFGNILLNTSNKSEAAVGYGTLYGDMAGGLSIIGDVYKMDVYRLAEHMNRDKPYIPINTITKPPSAELRPNQKDSDSLPDYSILDEILALYIEEQKGPDEIIALGHDEKLVKRILRMVNINEFKRYQTAPVLRVSPKAFGMGRRMPIVAKYLS